MNTFLVPLLSAPGLATSAASMQADGGAAR